MQINHVWEHEGHYMVFASPYSPGFQYPKDDPEIVAYLVAHPEALIPEPTPPEPTPEELAEQEAARIEAEEAEKDRAFGRAFRLAAESGDAEPIATARQAVSAQVKAIK